MLSGIKASESLVLKLEVVLKLVTGKASDSLKCNRLHAQFPNRVLMNLQIYEPYSLSLSLVELVAAG